MKRVSQLLVGVCTIAIVLSAMAEAASYQVVVNSKNQLSSISKKDLGRVYLKRTSSWPDGRSVDVVDQNNKNQAHRDFVVDVLGRDAAWVENYWQKMVFSGRGSAPTIKKTDAAVLEFVRANAGAVGYVSGGAEIGSGVKVLAVQ